jgi:hypothetical protein
MADAEKGYVKTEGGHGHFRRNRKRRWAPPGGQQSVRSESVFLFTFCHSCLRELSKAVHNHVPLSWPPSLLSMISN